jgi:hypothetical protein
MGTFFYCSDRPPQFEVYPGPVLDNDPSALMGDKAFWL